MGSSESYPAARADMVAAMIDLVREPRFEALRARAKEAPLLYDDFRCMPMPLGCDHDQIWELLNILRRHTAVATPYPDRKGCRGWYSLTNSIISNCEAISQMCCEGSMLDSALQSRDALRLFLGQLTGELFALLISDGVKLGYEAIREVLSGQEVPASPEQQLICNVVGILYDTRSMAAVPMDERFMLELRRRLVHRVEGVFVDEPSSYRDPMRYTLPWSGPALSYGEVLGIAADLLGGSGGDPAEHPLLLALSLDGLIVPSRLFDGLNNTYSWLLGRLLMVRRGYAALAYAPVHEVLVHWKQDMVRPASNGLAQADSIIMVDGTVDFTGYVSGIVELVCEEAARMEHQVGERLTKEEGLEASLMADPDINHRQRALIEEALRNPGAPFRISSHMKSRHVAYATARADLLGLEGLGLFDCHREGRAFVFTPRPDLPNVLSRRLFE